MSLLFYSLPKTNETKLSYQYRQGLWISRAEGTQTV